jgi:flagellar L-ring protein precursor FlgH
LKIEIMVLVGVAGLCQAQTQKTSALDTYVEEATRRGAENLASPGSLYSPTSRLGDLARDLRSSQVDDLVTILVSDRASALAKGTTNSNRKSSMKSGISAVLGPIPAGTPLGNLGAADSDSQLQGAGETTRETVLTTTLSARVINVLPNGYLVLEGFKDVIVNSERQQVVVRGVARWNDVGPDNTLRSDRLANLEVRIQGKGVVGDAIRRPNFLYRLLMGLLPF